MILVGSIGESQTDFSLFSNCSKNASSLVTATCNKVIKPTAEACKKWRSNKQWSKLNTEGAPMMMPIARYGVQAVMTTTITYNWLLSPKAQIGGDSRPAAK